MLDKEIIKESGLTDNESEVYLILIKLGEATIYEIADHSKISRPNVYDVVKKLLERGLATSIKKQNKKYIKPASPERLVEILKEKQKNILGILPDLMKTFEAKKTKPVIEVLTGPEGLKTIMNDMTKLKKDIWIYGGADAKFVKKQIPQHHFTRMMNEKKKSNIKTRIIHSPEVKPFKGPGYELKKLKNMGLGCVSYWAYGDRSAIAIWSEPLVLIRIISKEVAKTFRGSIKFLWKATD